MNDDLTGLRAKVASEARKLKGTGVLQDTWATDGVIFIRLDNEVKRVTTMKGLSLAVRGGQ